MGKKCILVSFFNSNNVGDVLLSNALFNDVSNNNIKVIKCSYEGDFKISNSIETKKSNNILGKVINKVKRIFKNYFFWLEFERTIKTVDFLIIGGGNMIMDLSLESHSAMHFGKFIDIAKKHNKKVFVCSIGIGPFHSYSQNIDTINVLNKCDYVTFRDQHSYNLANGELSENFFLSIDPVFNLPKFINHSPGKAIIGLGVINPDLFYASSERYQKIYDGYIELIRLLLLEGKKVILFSTEKEDYKTIYQLYDNFRNNENVIIEYIENPEQLFNLYTQLTYIISARMHTLIVGYTQGIPIIGLSWQQKVESFFELIQRTDKCIDIDQIEKRKYEIINYSNITEKNDYNLEILALLKKRYNINLEIINEKM